MKVEFCLEVLASGNSFKVYRTQDVSTPIVEGTWVNFGFCTEEPDFPNSDMVVMRATYHPPSDTTYVQLAQDLAEATSTENPIVTRAVEVTFRGLLADLLREKWHFHRHEHDSEEAAREYLDKYWAEFPGGNQAIVHLLKSRSYAIVPALVLESMDLMNMKYRLIEKITRKRKESEV